MITFLLGWCVLSVMGTLIALSLIRTGKRRQPEADDIAANDAAITAPAPQQN